MAERSFGRLIDRNAQGFHVSMGLDPNVDRIRQLYAGGLKLPTRTPHPTDGQLVVAFNRKLMEAAAETEKLATVKPNAAFYGALGYEEYATLRATSKLADSILPYAEKTIDAKVGDIDSTNVGYVIKFLIRLGFHSITLHPTLGSEAMKPFLERDDKGFYIVDRTSNKGAGEFQDEMIADMTKKFILHQHSSPSGMEVVAVGDMRPLYQVVADKVARIWNYNDNCGVVAGATYPQEAGILRNIVGPSVPLLIPGVGAQGQEAKNIAPVALRAGELGVINSSRRLMHPKLREGEDYWKGVQRAITELHNEIVTAQNQ